MRCSVAVRRRGNSSPEPLRHPDRMGWHSGGHRADRGGGLASDLREPPCRTPRPPATDQPRPTSHDRTSHDPSTATLGEFVARHIGPDDADIARMLEAVGHESLDALMAAALPGGIRMAGALDLPDPLDEEATARALRTLASQNRPAEAMIGLGYHATITPLSSGATSSRTRPGTPPTRRTSPRSPRAGSRRCSTSRPSSPTSRVCRPPTPPSSTRAPPRPRR